MSCGGGNLDISSGIGLLRAIGRQVRLIAPYDRWHGAGTTGTVLQVLFRDAEWLVGVQFDGVPGSYEDIPVGRFVRLVEWL